MRVEQDGAIYYLSNDVVPKLKKLRGHEHGEAKVVETLPGADVLGWRYTGPFDELPAWQRTGAEHRGDRVGLTSAPRRARASCISRRAVAARTSRSRRSIRPAGARAGGRERRLRRGLRLAHRAACRRGRAPDLRQSARRRATSTRPSPTSIVYPHCWRCKTELIFRLVDEWFISMGELRRARRQLRKRLVAITEQIRWIPGFGLDRELDWLRNMDDWMISKKRYWGLALPIYPCAACGTFEVIGSQEELHERAVAGWEEFEGHTPHRPWVDAVKIACATLR